VDVMRDDVHGVGHVDEDRVGAEVRKARDQLAHEGRIRRRQVAIEILIEHPVFMPVARVSKNY
jgi:hypothetical protein